MLLIIFIVIVIKKKIQSILAKIFFNKSIYRVFNLDFLFKSKKTNALMRFFSLISSFLVLNNVSCTELVYEPPTKKIKLELSSEESFSLDDEMSGLTIKEEWDTVFGNEYFTIFNDLINEVENNNFKKMKRDDSVVYEKILNYTKSLMDKSVVFEPNSCDDFCNYLKEIFKLADWLFFYMLEGIEAVKFVNAKMSCIKEKSTVFEAINLLLPTLIESLVMNENGNLNESTDVYKALKSMEERITALLGVIYNFCEPEKNILPFHDEELNLEKIFERMFDDEKACKNKDWDLNAIEFSHSEQEYIHNFFVKLNDFFEKAKKNTCFIFDTMNRLYVDCLDFNYYKKKLL